LGPTIDRQGTAGPVGHAAAVEHNIDSRLIGKSKDELREHIAAMQTAIRLHPPLPRDQVVWLVAALLEEGGGLPKVVKFERGEGRDLRADLVWHVGRKASIKTWNTEYFQVSEVIRKPYSLIRSAMIRFVSRRLSSATNQYRRPPIVVASAMVHIHHGSDRG
jgi:hypothetical protein